MIIKVECRTTKAKTIIQKFIDEDEKVTLISSDPYIAEFKINPKGMQGKLTKALNKIPANMLIVALTPWLNENFPDLNYAIDYMVKVER